MKYETPEHDYVTDTFCDCDCRQPFILISIIVSEIIARRVNHLSDEIEYLVQWKGFTAEEATWEPESNLTPELLEQMKNKFDNKYDYFVIPHIKQPRKQSKRPITPDTYPQSPPPASSFDTTVRSDLDHYSHLIMIVN